MDVQPAVHLSFGKRRENMVRKKPTSKKKGSRATTKKKPGPESPQKKRVQFVYDAPDAQEVALTGSFCDWTQFYPMKRDAKGSWKRQMTLPRGRHEYRFVVDGQWRNDPGSEEQAPNPFGEANSVIDV